MKICLLGDSWACGEWQHFPNGNYDVAHQGLDHYLSAFHTVTNLGLGGSSNNAAIARLKDCLQYNKFDLVFWFKTDPFRDLEPYDFLTRPQLSFDDIVQLQNHAEQNSYDLLNQLGIKVHCIGGCSKLNVPLMEQFNNLVPYIHCLSEMLAPAYQHPLIWSGDWQDLIDRQFDIDSLDKLLEQKRLQKNMFRYQEFFWPDGAHPNRYGHKILYEKICKDFNL